ncbi:hypothetical protein C5167_008678 [Papaver somniferum]|uniref:Uncharacterized protein n=1 Tax=Papaver somniferum TaxID=3469 RepID=A0A4Y7JZ69_PAPSO|nr:hypothetical protein C5167_008678 [Papaver somniferum]
MEENDLCAQKNIINNNKKERILKLGLLKVLGWHQLVILSLLRSLSVGDRSSDLHPLYPMGDRSSDLHRLYPIRSEWDGVVFDNTLHQANKIATICTRCLGFMQDDTHNGLMCYCF